MHRNQNMETLLMAASVMAHTDLVKYLIEKKANLEAKNNVSDHVTCECQCFQMHSIFNITDDTYVSMKISLATIAETSSVVPFCNIHLFFDVLLLINPER